MNTQLSSLVRYFVFSAPVRRLSRQRASGIWMMNREVHFSRLVLPPEVSEGSHLALIRDSTEAGDAIPFLLHISKFLSTTTQKQKVLFVSTRSRVSYNSHDITHVYPVLSRAMEAATAALVKLDLYTIQKPHFSLGDAQMQKTFTCEVITAVRERKPTVVIVECVQALKMVFGVDPSGFSRSLLLPEFRLNVIIGCPTQCGVDADIRSLEDIADVIFDLSDLQTGVSMDVDGIVRIAKEGGRWQSRNAWSRYSLTEAALKIHT